MIFVDFRGPNERQGRSIFVDFGGLWSISIDVDRFWSIVVDYGRFSLIFRGFLVDFEVQRGRKGCGFNEPGGMRRGRGS